MQTKKSDSFAPVSPCGGWKLLPSALPCRLQFSATVPLLSGSVTHPCARGQRSTASATRVQSAPPSCIHDDGGWMQVSGFVASLTFHPLIVGRAASTVGDVVVFKNSAENPDERGGKQTRVLMFVGLLFCPSFPCCFCCCHVCRTIPTSSFRRCCHYTQTEMAAGNSELPGNSELVGLVSHPPCTLEVHIATVA